MTLSCIYNEKIPMFHSSKGILKFSTTLCIVSLQILSGAAGNLFLEGEEFESLVSDKRFLHDQTSTKVWATLEQYAACSLKCIQGFEKLAEVCCNTGSDAVCLNLPWDILKNDFGQCSGIDPGIPSSASAIASLEQFAACSLTCVPGYEKLTEVCCKSGTSAVCSNLPWDILKTYLGSCQVANGNQTHCLSCTDVIQPSDCHHTVLCNPGEVCYTEFINLNGNDRYRLGCIKQTACAKSQLTTSGVSLVGKKRFVMDEMKIDKYCSKCCSDNVGNCNRELCHTSGVVPTGIDVSELVNPPERHDYCTDLYPDACKILVIQDPALCKQPRFSHYGCREYCGSCVNPGHITAQPRATSTAVPIAIPSPTPTPTQVSSPDCFYESTKYMGAYTSSISGKPCLKWGDIDPFIQGIPDNTLAGAGNKCRDPDGRGFPWCYTSTLLDWEYCPVPYCKECFYRNESVHYDGYVAQTKTKETCLSWSNSAFPLGNSSYLASLKNYCRDPFSSGTPQCFTRSGIRDCDVPVCPHECQDNSETNCDLIKQYVCRNEYTGVTLCPKTCGYCKFGLLPPRVIDPPKDVCVDNLDANCETLKFIICGDPDGALKLCPKTCGMCGMLYSSPSPTLSSRLHVLMTTRTTTTLTTKSFWKPWGKWTCEMHNDVCFRRRNRTCSTGVDKDCIDGSGGVSYRVELCTSSSCPEFFQTTTSTPHTSSTAHVICEDDPAIPGCKDRRILYEICKNKQLAWSLCPASCNICGTCLDYLNCSSASARKLFCSRDDYAVQYCRKSCGKCDSSFNGIQLNTCGDPVASPTICEVLQSQICICHDPEIRPLCTNFCDNKCLGHPFTGSRCVPAKRREREAVFDRLVNL